MPTSDYAYTAGTGILTITTTSFSAFEIAFKDADKNIPVADVDPLSDFPEELDVAYVFSATELVPEPEGDNGDYTDEQIEAFLKQVAPYGLWHADFVVTLDKDIDEGEIILGGQYDAWSESWVYPIYNPDPIEAGDELRLLAYASELLNQNIFINYAEICGYVKNFKCGVGAADDADLAGTTITVELRLYETYSEEECLEKFGYSSINEETGEYVSIGTYSYTFK